MFYKEKKTKGVLYKEPKKELNLWRDRIKKTVLVDVDGKEVFGVWVDTMCDGKFLVKCDYGYDIFDEIYNVNRNNKFTKRYEGDVCELLKGKNLTRRVSAHTRLAKYGIKEV